jgi:metal-sulfur cluster biosynthetic enzyme
VLGQLPNVEDVEVKVVLDPPWTPDRMTEDARDQLGIF